MKNQNALVMTTKNGDQIWDRAHEDGPTIVRLDGTQEYYKDGKFIDGKENILHRENGPAVIRIDGTKIWFQDGKHHREDGPAIEAADGEKMWYTNGVKTRWIDSKGEEVTMFDNRIIHIDHRFVSINEENNLKVENCIFTPGEKIGCDLGSLASPYNKRLSSKEQLGLILNHADIKPEEVEKAFKIASIKKITNEESSRKQPSTTTTLKEHINKLRASFFPTAKSKNDKNNP